MNHDAPNAYHVGGPRHALRGVTEQGAPDAVSLPMFIHRQAGEHGYRNGIGHVAPEPAGRGFNGDDTGGKGVITDHAFAVTDDVGA